MAGYFSGAGFRVYDGGISVRWEFLGVLGGGCLRLLLICPFGGGWAYTGGYFTIEALLNRAFVTMGLGMIGVILGRGEVVMWCLGSWEELWYG